MSYTFEERVIALAGVFQAAKLVQEAARHGHADASDSEICYRSLLVENPESVLDVYGGHIDNVRSGLITLHEQLGMQEKKDVEVTRYVMGMLFLERKLSKSPQMQESLSEGLEQVRRQLEHYSIDHENIIANLAGIYGDTLSTLSFRIMVSGEPSQLANTNNANRIRALLLGGIRSAVLWYQTGGRRWQLLFSRGKIIDTCLELLKEHDQ
ncbi:MAG: high frequency lysogenization protein HflD [Gammaproteobacteria bacterium]|nr:high frequency lysogenization protein HflD [Gammaproteobacteria bacterium]